MIKFIFDSIKALVFFALLTIAIVLIFGENTNSWLPWTNFLGLVYSFGLFVFFSGTKIGESIFKGFIDFTEDTMNYFGIKDDWNKE